MTSFVERGSALRPPSDSRRYLAFRPFHLLHARVSVTRPAGLICRWTPHRALRLEVQSCKRFRNLGDSQAYVALYIAIPHEINHLQFGARFVATTFAPEGRLTSTFTRRSWQFALLAKTLTSMDPSQTPQTVAQAVQAATQQAAQQAQSPQPVQPPQATPTSTIDNLTCQWQGCGERTDTAEALYVRTCT